MGEGRSDILSQMNRSVAAHQQTPGLEGGWSSEAKDEPWTQQWRLSLLGETDRQGVQERLTGQTSTAEVYLQQADRSEQLSPVMAPFSPCTACIPRSSGPAVYIFAVIKRMPWVDIPRASDLEH